MKHETPRSAILLATILAAYAANAPAGNPFKEIGNALEKVGEVVFEVVDGTLRPVLKETEKVLEPVAEATDSVMRGTLTPVLRAGDDVVSVGVGLLQESGEVVQGAMKNVVVPVVGGVGRVGAEAFGEIATYVVEHPEILLYVGAAYGIGWAMCSGGCPTLLSLTWQDAGGGVATLGLYTWGTDKPESASAPGHAETNDKPSGPAESTSDERVASGRAPAMVGATETVYPPYYNRTQFDTQPPRASRYVSLDEQVGFSIHEFAPPVYPAIVRVQTGSEAPWPGRPWDVGGEFSSSRSSGVPSSVIAMGSGMRRLHGATDFLARPGQGVFAPLSGTVIQVGEYPAGSGYKTVTIETADGTSARTLYLDSNVLVSPGSPVLAGRTQLGVSKDIQLLPQYKNTPRHVHVQFEDSYGRRFDPFTASRVSGEATPAGMSGVSHHRR